VNVVGSGSFHREFDLAVVANDLGSVANFDKMLCKALSG
jgi:hypothetical protein